jgi:hypothetical protein
MHSGVIAARHFAMDDRRSKRLLGAAVSVVCLPARAQAPSRRADRFKASGVFTAGSKSRSMGRDRFWRTWQNPFTLKLVRVE